MSYLVILVSSILLLKTVYTQIFSDFLPPGSSNIPSFNDFQKQWLNQKDPDEPVYNDPFTSPQPGVKSMEENIVKDSASLAIFGPLGYLWSKIDTATELPNEDCKGEGFCFYGPKEIKPRACRKPKTWCNSERIKKKECTREDYKMEYKAEGLETVLDKISGYAEDFFGQAADVLGGPLMDKLKNTPGADKVLSLFDDIKDAKEVADNMKDAGIELTTKAVETMKEGVDALKQTAEEAGNQVQEISNQIPGLGNPLSGLGRR